MSSQGDFMKQSPDGNSSLEHYKKPALLIGLFGLLIAGFGLMKGLSANDSRPVVSWLIGFSIWYSMAIGMLMIIMIWYLFDAGWSVIIRRQLEHAVAVFPWLALMFLPLLFILWFHSDNPGILWSWANPELAGAHSPTIAQDPIYRHKAAYLSIGFFTLRVVFYFALFIVISKLLRKKSFEMDIMPNEKPVLSARVCSALGVPAVALVSTFSAFDFYMSISYQWFSTMYGVWFFATSMRAGIAGTVLLCAVLASKGYLKGIIKKDHFYYLGCMALAFTVFWAYVSFSQYFLIYNANMPEETFWYNMRELNVDGTKSTWWYVSIFGLVFGYFLIPFISFLFYKTKIITKSMVIICSWVLAFHIIDLYFNILPQKIITDNVLGYVAHQFSINLWDIASYLGVGGICAWVVLKSMIKGKPIPIHDPRVQESIDHHE